MVSRAALERPRGRRASCARSARRSRHRPTQLFESLSTVDSAHRRHRRGAARPRPSRCPPTRRSCCCWRTCRIWATSARCCAAPRRRARATCCSRPSCAFAWSLKAVRAGDGRAFRAQHRRGRGPRADSSHGYRGTSVALAGARGLRARSTMLDLRGPVALRGRQTRARASPRTLAAGAPRCARAFRCRGSVESLNAAASPGSLALFEALRQRECRRAGTRHEAADGTSARSLPLLRVRDGRRSWSSSSAPNLIGPAKIAQARPAGARRRSPSARACSSSRSRTSSATSSPRSTATRARAA